MALLRNGPQEGWSGLLYFTIPYTDTKQEVQVEQSKGKQQSRSKQRINGLDKQEGKNIFKHLYKQQLYDELNTEGNLSWRKVPYDPEQSFQRQRDSQKYDSSEDSNFVQDFALRLNAIGNAVTHRPPGKEDAEHILWTVSPCYQKMCLFKKLICKVILLCFYYQNNLKICFVWEKVLLYYGE